MKCGICKGEGKINDKTCLCCNGTGQLPYGLFAENATSKYGFGDGDNPMGVMMAIVRGYLSEKLGQEVGYVEYGGLHNTPLDIDPGTIEKTLPPSAREEANMITKMYLSLFNWAEEFDPWEAEDNEFLLIVVPVDNGYPGEYFLGVRTSKHTLRKALQWKRLANALPFVNGLEIKADVGLIDPVYDRKHDFEVIANNGYAVFDDNEDVPFDDGGRMVVKYGCIWLEHGEFKSDEITDVIQKVLGGGS